jgi:hypothetical protein
MASNATFSVHTGSFTFTNASANHVHLLVEENPNNFPSEKNIQADRTCGGGLVLQISTVQTYDRIIEVVFKAAKAVVQDLEQARAAQATTSNLTFNLLDWDGVNYECLIEEPLKADHIRGIANIYQVSMKLRVIG